MDSSIKLFSEASLVSLLIKGGWVMLPISLLSILCVYAILDRSIALRNSKIKLYDKNLESINKRLLSKDYEAVREAYSARDCCTSRILEKGLNSFLSDKNSLESSIEIAARNEVKNLEQKIGLLANIASLAPLLGFFGTVTGMIQSFMAISTETNPITPNVIASGIYEALITTAAGLFVGIVATIGYNFFSSKVCNLTAELETYANELIQLFTTLQKGK